MVSAAEAKPKASPPCRVYVILARDAPVGVIFRRGPSKWVQILHWNTDTDTFTPGQWFHGRVYEKRSDLSPNGELLIYAARKEKGYMHRDKDYMPSWTALSKPPYLTALALWPCFSSIGGGLFFSDTKVWLNHFDYPEPHPGHPPSRAYVYTSGGDVAEEVLLSRRLERDGWRHTQEGQSKHEKPHPGRDITLVMTMLTGVQRHDHFSVRYAEGKTFALEGAEWADWDKRGRLVFAQSGGIFAQDAGTLGQKPPVELINLNDNKPEPIVAPDWAKVW